MKRFGYLIAVALVALAAFVVLHGRSAQADTKPSAMNIGIINVERVLGDTPEYQQKSQEYMEERKKLFDAAGAKNPKAYQQELLKRRPEIEAAQAKWEKIRQDFIAQSTDKIQKAADQVMQDKHLSFVLMDAPWYEYSPLRQYGAVDITTDVLLALKNAK